VFAPRKYIDMILKASAKWPNLNVGKNLEAGDYGTIDPESGNFEFHGNIYKNPEILKQMPELSNEEYQPQVSGPIKHWIVTANKTQQGDFDLGASADAAGLANASIKVKFKIKAGHRGAFLAMYSPRTIDLPKDVLLHKLYELYQLRGMFLVTSVFSCPAYCLSMTERGTESVKLAFVGNLPIPAAPGISAGGGASAGWVVDQSAGLYQEGCDPQGNYKFKPLYQMKKMRPRFRDRIFRDSPEPERSGDDLWLDVEAPWKPLGDDGEEDDFCDDVGDDD